MSDIKMSNLLALPVVRTEGGVMPFLKDGNGEVMFVGDGYHINAVVEAVNTHDTMQARIVELEKVILEVLDEHGDLADGDVCTLIKLKRVIGL